MTDPSPAPFRPGDAAPTRRRAPVVEVSAHGAARVVTAHGELDQDRLDPVEEALAAAAREVDSAGPDGVVVLDASGIPFGDSSFLNLLLRMHHRTRFRIVDPQPQIRRLLALTGTDGVLHLRPSVAAATAGD
ncbi:STAS domain-containing protein (plasmid) [Streptomyces sp. BI20]|uniref:STAS domain-containing protein n=1 Tax=Streptomyces sp. BI20 TaxID=3403460 RepID=UPI003C7399F2